MIEAIFLDLWKTLVYEDGDVLGNTVCPLLGIKNKEDFLAAQRQTMFIHDGDKYKQFERVCQAAGVEPNGNIAEAVEAWENFKPALYPNTLPVLDELSKDYKLALVSNVDSYALSRVLEMTGIGVFFDAIVPSCEYGFVKPDRRLFEIALRELEIKDARKSVMVGDFPKADIEGGRTARMHTILLSRQVNAMDTYRTFAPDVEIATLAELPRTIKYISNGDVPKISTEDIIDFFMALLYNLE